MEPRRRTAAWAAATVAAALLPFASVVAGVRTLAHRDTFRLYAPVRTLVVDALRRGRLPLWNPYEGAGKPLFAVIETENPDSAYARPAPAHAGGRAPSARASANAPSAAPAR